MISAALVSVGVAVVVATVFAARLTRHRPPPDPEPGDGWGALAPRSIEDVERTRTRLWPLCSALIGLSLVAAGVVVPAPPPTVERVAPAEATPRPYLVEVTIASVPTPSPTPTPSATPSPSPRTQSAGTGAARPATSRTPAPAQPPKTETPTPPPPPGPSVGASTSCFNNVLQIGYSLSANSGTTLSGLRVALNGNNVQRRSLSGRQYSGNYQASASPGNHNFTVTATASDGGSTTRTFPVRC